MNKKRLIRRLLVLVPLGFVVVVVARCSMWPFNYYHDYDVLNQAVLEAGCDIEQEIVNKDLTLEEIDFTIRTPSGWKLNLRFPDDRNMDQLCERPKGLLFQRPGGHSQLFSLEYLNESLQEKGVKLFPVNPRMICRLAL